MNEIFTYEFLVLAFFILSTMLFLCLLIQKLKELNLRSSIDLYKNAADEYLKGWGDANEAHSKTVKTAYDNYKELWDIIDNYKEENYYLKSDNKYLRECVNLYRDQETEVNNEEGD